MLGFWIILRMWRYICFACTWTNHIHLVMILVVFIDSVSCFERFCLFDTTLSFKFCIHLLKFISYSLLVTNIFESLLFFLYILFPLLLFNLLLQLDLHCPSLLFFFHIHDRFFITSSEDTSLFFEFQIKATVSYSSSCHYGWEISFCLNR